MKLICSLRIGQLCHNLADMGGARSVAFVIRNKKYLCKNYAMKEEHFTQFQEEELRTAKHLSKQL